MLVVHAPWSPGRGALIWGLDGGRPVKTTSQAVRSARAHPFAVDVEALAEIHAGKPASATLLLPSLRTAPLDSPELVRAVPRPSPQRPPALLPWVVPALLVDTAALAEESPQVRCGASVAHLRALAAFADDLAARGRVLPSLVVEAGQPAARWRPVVTGPDAARMHGLIAAMPPVARADLDDGVAAFRDRSLADTSYPYVFLDATYCKARVDRRVVSQAVVIATGVAADGHREVLGCNVGDSEDGRLLDRVPALPEGPRPLGDAAGHLRRAPRTHVSSGRHGVPGSRALRRGCAARRRPRP